MTKSVPFFKFYNVKCRFRVEIIRWLCNRIAMKISLENERLKISHFVYHNFLIVLNIVYSFHFSPLYIKINYVI